MNIDEEEIHRISRRSPNEVAKVLTDLYALIAEQAERFAELSALNAQLTQRIAKQAARIEELEDQVANLKRQLGQHSQNSHKPPSSDSFRKPTNLRKPGGKKGAPKGHPGHTLHQVDQPDSIVIHRVTACSQCSAPLEGEPCEGYEKRQVFDLPQPRIRVTEHRAERTRCPHCHSRQQAAFPERVTAPTQYGESLTAWAVYLLSYQMLPLRRACELIADQTGHYPSEATLLACLKTAHEHLAPYEQTIREQALASPVAHADETGVRIEGTPQWLHTFSTTDWTFQAVHDKRGSEAFDDLGLIPRYPGILVHDCNMPYFKDGYSFEHALCGAHLLRECQGIAEYDRQHWASHMKDHLQLCWRLAQSARQANRPLAPKTVTRLERRYAAILQNGETEWQQGRKREKTGPRGRKSKSKAANLGERFRLHQEAILRFLRDARVPFDNNQSERDLRMVKVKVKILGTFRTWKGAEQFARARSFISTLRKQQAPILSSLLSAIRHTFVFPLLDQPT
jgi:transposase/uncharacterized coiled-coil protein SlyX